MKTFTLAQVASMFDPPLTTSTILHHIKLGRLQALRNGLFVAIPEDEALAFVARHKAGLYTQGSRIDLANRAEVARIKAEKAQRHADKATATFKAAEERRQAEIAMLARLGVKNETE